MIPPLLSCFSPRNSVVCILLFFSLSSFLFLFPSSPLLLWYFGQTPHPFISSHHLHLFFSLSLFQETFLPHIHDVDDNQDSLFFFLPSFLPLLQAGESTIAETAFPLYKQEAGTLQNSRVVFFVVIKWKALFFLKKKWREENTTTTGTRKK